MSTMKLYKTTLLLFALIAGVSASWADPVSIPQAFGTYINWNNATKSDCQAENNGENLGFTHVNSSATFTITNETAQDYVLSFMSSSEGSEPILWNLKLTNNTTSTNVIDENFTVENTEHFTQYGNAHSYLFESLPLGTYTLTFTALGISGTYSGNLKYLSFRAKEQLAMPFENVTDFLDLTANFSNAQLYGGTKAIYKINRAGGSAHDIPAYVQTTGSYVLGFRVFGFVQNGKLKVTVKSFDGSVTDINQQAISITRTGYYTCVLDNITAGFKKISFDFEDEDDGGGDELYDVTDFYFAIDDFPTMGETTTYLNISQWSSGEINPHYDNSGYLGWIYNGGSVTWHLRNNNEQAYYYFKAGITTNGSGASIKITITDYFTSTIEEEETFGVAVSNDFATQTFKLANPISPGLKTVRLDFIKEYEEQWLYNLKDLTFYKRSLNGNVDYDYTPVEASNIDAVLIRTIAADTWNTIVLPFAMTNAQLTEAFGDNVKVAALASGDEETLNFNTVTATAANQPYAIKLSSSDSKSSPFTIEDVTITDATPTQTITNWNFIGTYSSTNIPTGSYFFSGNQLWQASDETNTIKPFRAYFTYTGNASAPQPRFIISSENNATNTDVIEAKEEVVKFFRNGQLYIKRAGATYDVLGRIIR